MVEIIHEAQIFFGIGIHVVIFRIGAWRIFFGEHFKMSSVLLEAEMFAHDFAEAFGVGDKVADAVNVLEPTGHDAGFDFAGRLRAFE